MNLTKLFSAAPRDLRRRDGSARRFWSDRPACFFALVAFFFMLNIKHSVSQNRHFDSIAQVVDSISFSQNTIADSLIKELYGMARTCPDSTRLIIKCLYLEAQLHYEQEILEETLPARINSMLTAATEAPFAYDEAILQYSLSMHSFIAGEFSEAFTLALQALNYFETSKDSLLVVKVGRHLGAICSGIGLLELSENYLENALRWCPQGSLEYYKIKHDKYKLYVFNGNCNTAIDSLSELMTVFEELENSALLLSVCTNLGTAHYICNMFDEVYGFWGRTEELLKDIDNPSCAALLYNNLGVIHGSRKKDHRKAIEYFNMAREIWERYGSFSRLEAPYSGLAISYEYLNEYDSALFYWRKNRGVSQRAIANMRAIEVYKKYVVAFLGSMENQLTIAEQEIELKNRQVLVIVIIAISLVLLALLFLLLLQQQKRRRVSENRELSARLEHDNKMQQLEKKQQEEIIDSKTREITSYSLLLSNKNNILQQILEVNEQGRNNRWDANEITRKTDEIIHQNLNIDKEWEDFKMHFEQVHPSFFDKLKATCSDLTEENLRLCAYFKIGMSTKQIAQLLHIIPPSVIKNRHRLKRKLGLADEEDLDDFIRNL